MISTKTICSKVRSALNAQSVNADVFLTSFEGAPAVMVYSPVTKRVYGLKTYRTVTNAAEAISTAFVEAYNGLLQDNGEILKADTLYPVVTTRHSAARLEGKWKSLYVQFAYKDSKGTVKYVTNKLMDKLSYAKQEICELALYNFNKQTHISKAMDVAAQLVDSEAVDMLKSSSTASYMASALYVVSESYCVSPIVICMDLWSTIADEACSDLLILVADDRTTMIIPLQALEKYGVNVLDQSVISGIVRCLKNATQPMEIPLSHRIFLYKKEENNLIIL